MAKSNVASITPEHTRLAHDVFEEHDPYERIISRLNGLKAIRTMAICILDDDGQKPTDRVWSELWYAVSLTVQDINRDLDELNGASS
jgi:hypothetical protein